MKIPTNILSLRNVLRLAMLAVLVCSMATVFLLYASPAQSVTLTVVNNSSKEIRSLYLSPVDNDNWGVDQLNDSAIGAGSSRTLSITWDQASVKLVAEDQEGCFLSSTVSTTSSIEWTITNDAQPNCGY